ncbi:SseB family protein [Streptomyces sp. NPDC020965]|uniref:SseB family protein n=1 Tax=Streptomyces sp. NPDC020965 TaxID=3365105 RepID=UPI0037BC0BC7
MTNDGGGAPEPEPAGRLTEPATRSVEPTPSPDEPDPPRHPGSSKDPNHHASGTPQGTSKLPNDRLAAARGRFAALLGEFRRAAVLVPIDPHGSLWTSDHGGVRWICAFSDERALARFAYAQGDADREWTYQTILGARLLDVMVPALGIPTGVALDAGSADGILFPPIAGIVPDSAAVDLRDGSGTPE